jgi:hypothetical protein
MEALHEADLAQMEAEKAIDEAEHREDMGRIQAKIDAERALADAE